MQAVSSTDGTLYSWISSAADYGGVGYPGTGIPESIVVVSVLNPDSGGGGGGSAFTSSYVKITDAFTTGTSQPGAIADSLMASFVLGGSAGPGPTGTVGIIARSFSSSTAETGTASGQAGLGSTASALQPYNTVDFPGGRFFGPLLKPNGQPPALIEMLSGAQLSFPDSVAAPVVVFWSFRSDLGANLKWHPWFYFRNQATGLMTPFTPDTSIGSCKIFAPVVEVSSGASADAGLGVAEALSGSLAQNQRTARVTAVTSSPYSVLMSDEILEVNFGGTPGRLNLPVVGKCYIFCVKDTSGTASTNNITLHRAGSETIEGTAADRALATNRGTWTVWSDGTGVYVAGP